MRDIFVGTEAVADGVVTRHDLARWYRAFFRNVYADRRQELTVRDRAVGAWLWSKRRGIVTGVAASAMHGAEWVDADVDIALYCCGAYRAMNKAALNFYETVRREGTQKDIIDTLQTRNELYDFLGYHAYEDKLDQLFAQNK